MDNYDFFKDEALQEDWVNLSEPVFSAPVDTESEKEKLSFEENKSRNYLIAPVLTFQLTVTILLLISLFVIKTFFPELSFKVKKIYDAQMSRSMITDGDFRNFDYHNYFSSSADEV